MWIEKRGKAFRAFERYKNPFNGKLSKVSVKMPRNTPQERTKAQRRLDVLVAEKTNIVPDKIYLSQLSKFYLRDVELKCKKSTYLRNKSACNTFEKLLGDVELNGLNARYVRKKFLQGKMQYNEYVGRFKTLIRWGYRNDFLEDISFIDKLDRVPEKTKREKVQDKFLERDECNKLIDGMKNEKWKLLTKFLVLSGCRIGEALALEESDLDFDNRSISISKTVNPATKEVTTAKTLASEDSISMQDELDIVCHDILELKKRTPHLPTERLFFDSEYAAYLKYLRVTGEKILHRHITPHIFRHTHAALLCENDKSYDYIQRRLRHEKNARVTQEIYIHFTEKLKEKDKAELKEVKLL